MLLRQLADTRDWPAAKEGEGERLLLASIIRRAAFDIALYKHDRKYVNRYTALEAYQWMFEGPHDHFTSFVNICEILGVNPYKIRAQTLRLKRRDVKKYDRVNS